MGQAPSDIELELLQAVVDRQDQLAARLDQFAEQQQRILDMLAQLLKAGASTVVRESYTVEDVAKRLGRTPWTVRNWANNGQVRATKVRGKGRTGEWRIAHEELLRVEREGPSPEGAFDNRAARPVIRRAS